MGILLNLIQNTERLNSFIEDEVFNYAYEALSESGFESCILVSYNHQSELTLSFVIEDPSRIFKVNLKEGLYNIRMKDHYEFSYEDLPVEDALKTLYKLKRRQAI